MNMDGESVAERNPLLKPCPSRPCPGGSLAGGVSALPRLRTRNPGLSAFQSRAVFFRQFSLQLCFADPIASVPTRAREKSGSRDTLPYPEVFPAPSQLAAGVTADR